MDYQPLAGLRQQHPAGGDEAHFELTTASEKAIEWLASLSKRQFVGTESHLLPLIASTSSV